MSAPTVAQLRKGSFALFAFRAVKSNDTSGRPLVWRKTNRYAIETQIQWPLAYQAYTSFAPLTPNQRITPGFSTQASLGQTLKVDQAGAIGTVINSGAARAISIDNQIKESFTCGLSQDTKAETPRDATQGGEPFCGFPIFPGFVQVPFPIEQVLVVFSSAALEPGDVINGSLAANGLSPSERFAVSPALLIDLTGVTERRVSFDLTEGWQWGNQSWGVPVAATADLVPILIRPM